MFGIRAIWSRYTKVDPGISLGQNLWSLYLAITAGGGMSAWLLTKWTWYWDTFGWGGVPIGFIGSFAAISICIFLAGLGRFFWSSHLRGGSPDSQSVKSTPQPPPPATMPNLVDVDRFGAVAITRSPPSLRNSVFVSNMKLHLDAVADSRASELTMTVFNGSGRVIEFGRTSGRIKYKVRNGDETSSERALPTPAVDPNSASKAVQLEECHLVLRQPVPPEDATAFRLRAGTIIYFDLTELEIEVYTSDDRNKKEQLKLWDGVTVSRGSAFGRIKNATVNISMGMRASTT